jgi:hypothetical protein
MKPRRRTHSTKISAADICGRERKRSVHGRHHTCRSRAAPARGSQGRASAGFAFVMNAHCGVSVASAELDTLNEAQILIAGARLASISWDVAFARRLSGAGPGFVRRPPTRGKDALTAALWERRSPISTARTE